MNAKSAFLIIVSILFSACATPYQPNGFGGGYSETQLGEKIFRVSFQGNGHTSAGRAEDFALLRSAEVALEHGFSYFVIVQGNTDTTYGSFTTPTQSTTIFSGNTAQTTTYGGQTFLIRKPSASNVIVCFTEKPEINGLVFDAHFLVASLTKKYQALDKPAPLLP